MATSQATGFDASRAMAELSRVFGQYRVYNTRSTALLLSQLAEKLQIDLYQECTGERQQQQAKIEAVPQKTDYRVTRRLRKNVGSEQTALATFRRGPRKGQFKSKSIVSQIRRASDATHVTVDEEIRLRKRFAAVFQASGWLNSTIRRLTRPFRMVPEAVKVERLDGTELRVTITNPRPNSSEFGESTGYIARAFINRTADMQKYIQRKINGDAMEFSRPKPNFAGKSAEAAVTEAMSGAFSKAA